MKDLNEDGLEYILKETPPDCDSTKQYDKEFGTVYICNSTRDCPYQNSNIFCSTCDLQKYKSGC